jgi:hypothetical protein
MSWVWEGSEQGRHRSSDMFLAESRGQIAEQGATLWDLYPHWQSRKSLLDPWEIVPRAPYRDCDMGGDAEQGWCGHCLR